MEFWKPIPSAQNYEASSLGRIRRAAPGKKTRVGAIIKPKVERNGYLRVSIYHGGIGVMASVHRLVCEAFHGAPALMGQHVAHTDGDKLNNRSDNLRWASPLENEEDKRRHGTTARGERQGASRLTEEQVREIKRVPSRHGLGRDLATKFNVSPSTIALIRANKSWRHVSA
jgi:hypothetical protein